MYDIIIIGAGPAGISAGVYAVSRGKKTLVIEKDKVGGLIGKVSTVTHFASVSEDESGESFSERLKAQAKRAGVEIKTEEVKSVKLSGDVKEVKTDKASYQSKKIIIANGTSPRMLHIPGEKELSGLGMRMNAARDCEKYSGKNVYVVGGADGAVKEALFLAEKAKKVTIIHFEDSLGCISEFREKVDAAANIELRLSSRLKAVYGVEQVESLDILNEKTGAIETVENPGCGIFVYAGACPNTEMYTELTLENGFVPANENMETEISGVYAIGDIRVKNVRQVATAVSDGAVAAIHAAK